MSTAALSRRVSTMIEGKGKGKGKGPVLRLTRPVESPMELWEGALTRSDANRLKGALSRREYHKVHVNAYDRNQPTQLKGDYSQYQRWMHVEKMLRTLARKSDALGVSELDKDIAARIIQILRETFVARPATPYVTRRKQEDVVS